jgi:hypothetical protein
MHALQFAKTGSQQVHAGNSSTFHFALQTKAACEKSWNSILGLPPIFFIKKKK